MKKSVSHHDKARRSFLGKTAAAGSYLFVGGLYGNALSAFPGRRKKSSTHDVFKTVVNSPVILLTQPTSRDVDPRAVTWIYIREILQRAGIFFDETSPSGLASLKPGDKSIVILAGDLDLTSEIHSELTSMVEQGGSLIGLGGTSGLDKVFGVKDQQSLAEGWIKVTDEKHPVTKGLRSSLHVFGGNAFAADKATSLAEIETGYQGPKGSTILENNFGNGRAMLLAPDMIFSIVHIQQGVPVLQDAPPSPDGTAMVNDGELKAEDGLVLDWDRDRTIMQPDNEPAFLEPITDELREIILRSIFHVASQQKIRLPVLWYWPRGLKAICHISHDTDGNEPEKAEAMLDVMLNRCHIKSTWATLYPGGYPKAFYQKLKEADFEIGLHYDARTGGKLTSWSKENFLFQKQWLMDEAGIDRIYSNKNHYTRWENKVDFYRWCEEAGIDSDETRGPSKKGTIGFSMGGSQPYFPIDDEGEKPRLMNVMEINLITQDLVVVCPKEYGKPFLDSAMRHHGVAHFLFHPAHIQKPHVADALCSLVKYGKDQGLEWWKNEQIVQWEKQRRRIKAHFNPDHSFTLSAKNRLSEATILVLNPQKAASNILINDRSQSSEPWNIYGFDFEAITTDLKGETKFDA